MYTKYTMELRRYLYSFSRWTNAEMCFFYCYILSHFPTVKLTKASHSNRTRIDGVEGEHVCHLTALDLVMHTLTIEVCLNLALGLVTSCYAHKIVC